LQINYKQWGPVKQKVLYFFSCFNYSDTELSLFNMFGFEACNYLYEIQVYNDKHFKLGWNNGKYSEINFTSNITFGFILFELQSKNVRVLFMKLNFFCKVNITIHSLPHTFPGKMDFFHPVELCTF